MKYVIMQGNGYIVCLCLEGYISVLLLPYSISTGALGSHAGLLLPYSIKA